MFTIRRPIQKKTAQNFWHMSKFVLPYIPSTIIRTTCWARSATLVYASFIMMIKGQASVLIGSPNTPMHMQNAQKGQYLASSCKLKLVRFSTLLRFQDRAKCGKGTDLHGGDTTQKNLYWKGGTLHITSWWVEQRGWGHRTTLKESIYWEGGHRTYFVGVGTPHNIYRKSLAVGGWVVQARE